MKKEKRFPWYSLIGGAIIGYVVYKTWGINWNMSYDTMVIIAGMYIFADANNG